MTEQAALFDQQPAMTPEQRTEWRSSRWRMFTRCQRCGQVAFCVGRRRRSMVCSSCFIKQGRRRRT